MELTWYVHVQGYVIAQVRTRANGYPFDRNSRHYAFWFKKRLRNYVGGHPLS